MGGRARFARRGNGGLHPDHGVDASKLNESCPVQRLYGKGTPKTYDDKVKKMIEVGRKNRALRQAQQSDSNACMETWIYELLPLSGGKPIKRSEMTERDAALKNKSIKELGLYWRRAPY